MSVAEAMENAPDTRELLYEIKDGIATITLNRPEKLNAFTPEMINAWVEALRDAKTNDEVRVVVVTGAGRAFCAGGDVNRMGGRVKRTLMEEKNHLWEHIHRIALTLEDLDKPVIAAINGVAAGAGLDMALMCDIRFMADNARVNEAYVKVGLIPGDGGTYFLPRLIGPAKALELFWTGDWVDAEQALALGIVNRVYPADELMPAVYEFAGRLATGPSLAIRMIKRAVYQSFRMDLRTHLDMLSSHMVVIRHTHDHVEGSTAFRERRTPNFRGM